MLTTEERLDNLEAGIVQAADLLFDAAADSEIDDALAPIREEIQNIYKRITAIRNTIATSKAICKEQEKFLAGSGEL